MLVIDGKVLTENTAIITYLNRSFPNARLLPAGDALAEAEALAFIAWCASGIHPVMGRFFGPQNFCDMPDSADNVKALAAKATAANFALVEKALAGKDWVFGTWSAADAYISSEEHTSELPSLMRISYAVFCLKNKNNISRYESQQ